MWLKAGATTLAKREKRGQQCLHRRQPTQNSASRWTMKNRAQRIQELRKQIDYHSHLYYVEARTEISTRSLTVCSTS